MTVFSVTILNVMGGTDFLSCQHSTAGKMDPKAGTNISQGFGATEEEEGERPAN